MNSTAANSSLIQKSSDAGTLDTHADERVVERRNSNNGINKSPLIKAYGDFVFKRQ